jgi:hypothetical protein
MLNWAAMFIGLLSSECDDYRSEFDSFAFHLKLFV